MTATRESLEAELSTYQDKLRGITAYVDELTRTSDTHGTPTEHIAADLQEAQHNMTYYEAEIARLQVLLEEATADLTYRVFQDAAGQWRWQLRAANHRIIADSAEGYASKQACLHGLALVKVSGDAPIARA